MNPNNLVCSYGSALLLKHLHALQQEVVGVRIGEDIECIHRMRVASRRFRAALPLFKECLTRKKFKSTLIQVKQITQALGAARDTDVQLDLLASIDAAITEIRFRPGLRRLELRIGQNRRALQKNVLDALDLLDKTNFFAMTETELLILEPDLPPGTPYPHLLFERSAAAIATQLSLFHSYEPFLHRPECVSEHHAMRIAAKQLRYTLETFAPLYPGELQPYLQAVKTSQELLGDMHDCDVWLVFLPQFMKEEMERTIAYYGHANPFRPLQPGLDYFLRNRQEVRSQKFQSFGDRWESWKSNNLWAQLEHTIHAPVYHQVFPLSPEPAALEE
jgi:CHAD domain-containing protein